MRNIQIIVVDPVVQDGDGKCTRSASNSTNDETDFSYFIENALRYMTQ